MVVDFSKVRSNQLQEIIEDYDSAALAKLIDDLCGEMREDANKWVKRRNKAAAARLRKKTLLLNVAGKAFRKLSLQEIRDNDFIE